MTLWISCQWWLNPLFNKSWDKSLIIGYNLQRFANSLNNSQHVNFANLVGKKWDINNDFPWYFYSIVNTCVSKWTRNDKHKLKLVHLEKIQRVYDAQTRKNANPGLWSFLILSTTTINIMYLSMKIMVLQNFSIFKH